MGGCCIAFGLRGGLKIYVVAASGFEMTVVRVDAGAVKPLGDLWVTSGFAMGGLGWCTLLVVVDRGEYLCYPWSSSTFSGLV
jgi:hypothetical protein